MSEAHFRYCVLVLLCAIAERCGCSPRLVRGVRNQIEDTRPHGVMLADADA